MRILDKLINRLHRVFSRDPENIPVMSISFEGDATLRFDGLTLRTETPLAGVSDELIVNPYFVDGLNGWTVTGGSGNNTITLVPEGVRFYQETVSPAVALTQTGFTPGRLYRYNIKIADVVSYGLKAFIMGVDNRVVMLAPGTYEGEFIAVSDTATIYRYNAPADATLAFFSIKEVVEDLAIDLSTMTVNDLVAAINVKGRYSATLIDASFGNMLARGLYPVDYQDLSQDTLLYYPQSKLIAEMRTAGWALEEQKGRLKILEDQLYLDSASGRWLDYWGKSYFDNPRFPNEDDTAYAVRIIYEAIRATQNNKALELILSEALGIDASVIDAWPVRTELASQADRDSAPGHFILDMEIPNGLTAAEAQQMVDNAQDVIRRYKASGTDFLSTALQKLQSLVEPISANELQAVEIGATPSDQLQAAPIYYGAGWRYGTPGLTYGDTDPIKEQVMAQKINASTAAVEQTEMSGG